jgi:YVTN family beta-propeller protein
MRVGPAERSRRSLRWALAALVVVTLVATGLGALATGPRSPHPSLLPTAAPASRTPAVASVPARAVPAHSASAVPAISGSVNSAGVVTRTIFPGFNTSLPGSFTSSVATWVMGTPTYVPSTNTLWFPQRSVAVPGDPWPTLAPAAVFNLTTGGFDRLVTNLTNASAVVYDPGNGDVYATLLGENSVVAVNPRTGALLVPAIPVGSRPDALAYDANTNQLFVANNGSANVTVIDAQTNKVVIQGVSVGNDPVALVDDSRDGLVFVANSGSGFLTVLNTSHPATLSVNISMYDGNADGLAFSPRSDMLIATTPSNQNATLIVAKAKTPLNAELSVGKGVVPCAVSANGTEFVLGNGSGSDILVLNSSTGSQIGSPLPSLQNVTELAVDPITGKVYCWTSSNRVLESLNLSKEEIEPVGPTTLPQINSESYYPSSPRIYAVATSQSLTLSLNTTTLVQVAPALTSSPAPLSVAEDPTGDRFFLGTTDGVEVYNASTDASEGTVSGLTGTCDQLVLDRAENLLWLSNTVLGVVAVNLSTLQVAISPGPTLASSATEGIAVDVQDSEIFVLVSTSSIDVRNSRTGEAIASGIAVGENVTSLVFDPADDRLYAAGDTVSILSPSNLTVDGSVAPFGGAHRVLAAAYDPSGSVICIASVGGLSTLQGMLTEIDGSSSSASADSWIQFPVGEEPRAIGIVASGQGGSYGGGMVWVANEQSGTISVISTPPEVTYFQAVPAIIDLGETTSLDVAVEGGAGPTSEVFAALPPGCLTSDVFELSCTPTVTGNYTINVTATDSLGVSANASTSLSVVRALSIRTSFSPASFPEVDVGVPLRGTAEALNGLPPYAFEWSLGDGSVASGAEASHTYVSPGTYIVNTQVRDASGASVNSSSLVTVVPRPTVSIAASPGLGTDVDRPISFYGNVSGGAGGSGGNWSFGDGTNAFGSVVTHAWTSDGSYNVTFRFVDSLGVAANSSVEVLVNPPLTATFVTGKLSATTSGYTGTLIPFTAVVSGGTWPYAVLWSFGDGSNASGQGVMHAYAAAGTYSVSVVLSDAAGASLRSNLTVSVTTLPTGAGGITSLGGGFGTGLFLGLIVGGVLAAVVLFAAGPRRRSAPPPSPPTPYVPP